MSSSLVTTGTNSDFFKSLSKHQNTGEAPKPVYVRLDGNTGVYNELTFNEVKKDNDKKPFLGGGEWKGAILLVKWFAKSKYKKGAMIIKRTREFSSFQDEKVKFIEINYDSNNESKALGTYENYAAFKDAIQIEYGRAVNEALAKKEPIPQQNDFIPELFGSIYVYNFDLDRVVNVKVKGKSRSALFDYLSKWRRGVDADSISQVLTSFGTTEFESQEVDAVTGNKKKYFATRFKAESLLDEAHQSKVREAVMATLSWMKSFTDEDTEVVSTEVLDHGVTDVNEIRLQDIPF